MPIGGIITCLLAGIAAFAVAALVRRHALALGLVAEPNARSSHSVPTPSGGGLGIVAGGTIGGVFAAFHDRPDLLLVTALALLVAALGFVDDRRPLPALLRLPVQLLLVGLMAALVSLSPLLRDLGFDGAWLPALAVLTLAAVYWLNIFNFMDGIDGLAGAQAAFMLGAGVLLALPAAGLAPQMWWMAALATATLGFLVLNWPPARIFMGDAGSTYLGAMIAWLALVSVAAGWLSAWQWLILGALFIADASLTLLRRLLRREPIFSAHRLHAYQHLSRRWRAHLPVTLLYLAVNLVLLLPLAWWAGLYPATALLATLAAYLPVVAGLLWAGAGAPEQASA